MSSSIELTAKYIGERMHFDNNDGSRTVIAEVLLSKNSKDIGEAAGIDPYAPLAVKGEADSSELRHNQTYRFFGTWTSYFNRRRNCREKQFHFRTFVANIPHDPQGIADYLSAAGRGNGIGPSKARRLVDRIGVDSVLHECRTSPSTVVKFAEIRLEQAERFAAKLIEQQATESATLEVDQMLGKNGFPKTLVRKVIKTWGNKAAEKIANDPYSLMQFRGVGFAKTDKLYIGLGKDPASVDRQALCLWYTMASDNDGHTWFEAKNAVRSLYRSIGGDSVDYRAAIIRGREYGQISDDHYGAIASIRTHSATESIADDGDQLWLAEGRHAAAERYVADAVARSMNHSSGQQITRYEDVEHTERVVLDHVTCRRCRRLLIADTVHVLNGVPYGPTCITRVYSHKNCELWDRDSWLQHNPVVLRWIQQQPSGILELPSISLWPDPSQLERCTDHQREQYAIATSGRIGILGGCPGTGKTYSLAEIIKAVHKTGRVGFHEMGVGAPTGKAAVRLTEALNAAGITLRARTVHSLLGVGSTDEGTGQWSFQHNENNQWPFKMMFFDEQSMTDIGMMANIFKAMPPGCHALFVGDVNQLPPVGNGAPFRDMIDSSLPYGELTKIERNSGGIVESCAKIRNQQPWTDDCVLGSSNLVITGDRTPNEQIERLVALLDGQHIDSKFDPVWDCQVLVAVNKSSKLSRSDLNTLLQERLNPNPKVDGTPFRTNDKVVCLKNGFFASVMNINTYDEDYDVNDAGEVYVANGELGQVESIQEKFLRVKLTGPDRLIQIPRGKQFKNDDGETSTGCSWDLGYALSTHKFQGSEQRFVFVMLDSYAGARMVCDRAWIYTSNSRAKEMCFLIGTAELANRFCTVQKISNRRTMLAKRIALSTLENEVVGL